MVDSLYCQYCGSQLDNDAAFCSKCGKQIIRQNTVYQQQPVSYQPSQAATQQPHTVYQTNISSNAIDDKTKIARGMASHFLISGILLCIFGVISLLLAGLMLLAKSYAGVIDELSYEPKAYTFAMLFYIILAIVGFSWAIARFVGRGKILKSNQYSANGVITSSVTLCAVFVLRIITNLNLNNAYGVFFCLLLVGIIIYEIIGIIIYAFIHRDVYVIEVHDALDDIPEYVEEPSKWDEILKTEYIEPIDETEDLYSRYMDYRKDRLVEILDKPNDYQEIAVKVARYVYYKRFCNAQE